MLLAFSCLMFSAAQPSIQTKEAIGDAIFGSLAAKAASLGASLDLRHALDVLVLERLANRAGDNTTEFCKGITNIAHKDDGELGWKSVHELRKDLFRLIESK